jgi:hypothetical protein
MYWSSVNLRQTFEVHIRDQKIGVQRIIIAPQIIRPVSFEQTVNSERYVNVLRALQKKKDMAILCKMVLQHTLLIIPLFFLTRCLNTD